jgi:cardiolipin synthase
MSFVTEHLGLFFLIINTVLSFIIVFRERKDTVNTWAWLLVLTFIPILGFVLYVFFGKGISKERIFDLKMQTKIGMNVEVQQQQRALERGLFPKPTTNQVDPRQLIYMLTMFESSLYTTKNEVTLYTDGREKFDALLEDIHQARYHIHMEYYIYRADELGLWGKSTSAFGCLGLHTSQTSFSCTVN